ncbi:MAG: NAD(P)H-dependent oxidoreductase [Planctomycetota bacterium]
MSLNESLRWRYATKAFDPARVVPDEQVNQILEAGNLAPTSYGLQPFKFVVIQNQELQDQLVPFSYDQNQVAEASHVIVIAARTDIDVDYVNDYAARIESVRELPSGAVDGYRNMMVGTVSGMSDDDKRRWNSKQAYIALGMMLSAAAELGIDSCPMEGFVAEEYDRLLGLADKNLKSVVLLPIGYRSEDDKAQHSKKVRFPLNDIIVKM